jgi:hypothetical protein
MPTKKNITDSIIEMATRFSKTDESRIDEDWLSYTIDKVRAELIIKEYQQTNIIDQTWFTDIGLLTFHQVNFADNITVDCDPVAAACGCNVSKTTVPQFISLKNKDGNLDLGLWSVISPCGKTTYYPERMSMWRYTPECHTNSLFGKYTRINTSLYVNRVVEKLRIVGIPLNPEDGILTSSAPVPSGSIVLGTVYRVKCGQIIYAGVVYQNNDTFTGTSVMGADITTYQGSGFVYKNSQIAAYRDVDPYPASGDMIRMIELEILTKEFGIERQMIPDIRNDSKDDASKTL